MAQVCFVKVNKDWVLLEDLISESMGKEFNFDATKTYQFEARGSGYTYLCDSSEKPKKNEGIILDLNGMKIARYKTGINLLYVRSSDVSYLNVSTVGE